MGWLILIIIVGILIYYFKFNENHSIKEKRRKSTDKDRPKKRIREEPSTSTINSNSTNTSDIDYFGSYNSSENEIFTVGCDDSDYKADSGEVKKGGFRNKGMGRVVFRKNKKVKWTKEFERPNDAEVSNKGFVALNDWLLGKGLKGKFYLLSPEGKVLIADKLAANLQKLGITSDSKLAWTTTAVSDNSDSSKLIVYSIPEEKRLFKTKKLYGSIVNAKLKRKQIEFTTNADTTYKFNYDGKITNHGEIQKQLEKHKLNSEYRWEVNAIVKDKLNEFEDNGFKKEEVEDIINKLEQLDVDSKDKYLAKSYRYLGELKLLIKKKKEALSYFEKALKLDSKVGIKRKYKMLEKDLES